MARQYHGVDTIVAHGMDFDLDRWYIVDLMVKTWTWYNMDTLESHIRKTPSVPRMRDSHQQEGV